ncbi:MAG: galactosyldiacylglycerol synthase [Acidobacteria bacterium]|nr:galactosyldiacylglycerol synthase [Acidobacteriota bacterium]
MTAVDFVYFDAGGGHRSSATALCEVIARQQLLWQTRMVNLQEILDPLDFIRKLTGVRIQDTYNAILKKGWTLGSAQLLKVLQAAVRHYHDEEVGLLRDHWARSQPDLVVSLVPHFNRALKESLAGGGVPFVTILTDIADFPPHFWIESQDQYVVCGSEKAAQQAREAGIAESHIYRSSGMIVHPRFYEPVRIDRQEERRRLGLKESLPTALVMFGGQGSEVMLEVASRVNQCDLPVQMIYMCGHNVGLAEKLKQLANHKPQFVEGFTREIPYYMSLADFFIGKPGPGSVSEALLMKLPVIVQRNALTLPQERYNTEWILENEVGLVVESFRHVVPAIREMLDPQKYSRFHGNTANQNSRAVLEIPDMLKEILARELNAQGALAAV